MKAQVKTVRTVSMTVDITLEEPLRIEDWQGWSHRGKTVQLSAMRFQVKDGTPGSLYVYGTVLKKDGKPGMQGIEHSFWRSWAEEGWLPVHVDARQLAELIQLAREQLRVLESQS